MFDVFLVTVIIGIITFTIWLLSRRIKDYRKAETDKIFSIGKVNVMKNGFIFNLIICLVYLGIFIYESKEIYQLLNPKYLENIFQMFNIKHLEYLEATFSENEMFLTYLEVSRFRNQLFILLITIVIELCFFTYRYSLTKIENMIYSNGLLLNGKLILWHTIKAYQWEDKKDFFNNKPVKTLTIKSNTESRFTFACKQSIDVTEENKRMINYYLKSYNIQKKNIS
ncbi:MAG TPA: DUF5673 domain-containing protein [Clostridia bacterium]|nr:DUF5673 domain-containing protein [Clostridia bacterium]